MLAITVFLLLFTCSAIFVAIYLLSTMPTFTFIINNNELLMKRTIKELKKSEKYYYALFGPTAPYYLCNLTDLIIEQPENKEIIFIFPNELYVKNEVDKGIFKTILNNNIQVYRCNSTDIDLLQPHFRIYDDFYAYIEESHELFQEIREGYVFKGMKDVVYEMEKRFKKLVSCSILVTNPETDFDIQIKENTDVIKGDTVSC